MNVLNQQLKKGVLEILVLKIINSEDIYGYDLIKKLESQSNGFFVLKEGSLYPIMYRLEDKGLIKSYRQEFTGQRKVPRKYYKITSDGKTSLSEMIGSWTDFYKIVNTMLNREEYSL